VHTREHYRKKKYSVIATNPRYDPSLPMNASDRRKTWLQVQTCAIKHYKWV
jgi:hypothetical protein